MSASLKKKEKEWNRSSAYPKHEVKYNLYVFICKLRKDTGWYKRKLKIHVLIGLRSIPWIFLFCSISVGTIFPQLPSSLSSENRLGIAPRKIQDLFWLPHLDNAFYILSVILALTRQSLLFMVLASLRVLRNSCHLTALVSGLWLHYLFSLSRAAASCYCFI